MKLEQALERQLADLVRGEGLELVTTEVVGSGPKAVLRLIVDGPDGVTLDQCADVSRQASVLLDVEDPIRHAYTLEVSSPGLDRKLYSPADYVRFSGRRVKVRMQPSYRAQRVLIGELVGLEGERIELRVEEDTVSLPLDEVFETRLEVDWEQIMKEGKTRP